MRDRAHATSDPPQIPSTHAAARYEPPLAHVQHVGLQSAYVEQLSPAVALPTSFSGFEGHPPFTCSALDETFELLEPLELLELLALSGSLGSEPEAGVEEPPPLHARRKRAVARDAPRQETQRGRIAISRSG